MYKKMIKQAFTINKAPISLEKAIGAAICSGVPIILGILFKQVKYGMWGSIGSFTYMYSFNEPYVQRAKKMFIIALAVTFCSTLGILVSDSYILIIILVGLIGAVSTFIFGTFKIAGPGPIVFILTFSMTSGMKGAKSEIPIFLLVVLCNSLFAWAVSMIGYFFDPYKIESEKVKMLYYDLAQFSKSIGNNDISKMRSKLVNSLKGTEEIINIGFTKWRVSFAFNKLYLLSQYANKMYLEMLELDMNKKVPEEIIHILEELQKEINLKFKNKINLKKIKRGKYKEYDKLLEVIYDIESIINLPEKYIGKSVSVSKISMIMLIKKSFDKDSIVFENALRYGIVLSFAAFIAHKLNVPKSYWITLGCASVMCGNSIMATFNRAFQRSIGTIVGVILAVSITAVHPHGYMIAVINMLLIALFQIFTAKNYGLASIFITINTIFIAESFSSALSFTSLATSRIENIIIGSMIGLLGTYLIDRKSASSRINMLISKSLHSQAKVIFYLNKRNDEKTIKICRDKMEINFNNLKLAYSAALGEISNNKKRLEMVWPAVFALEHINYILSQYCADNRELNLSVNKLEQIIFIYESMANNIEQKTNIKYEEIERLNDDDSILYREIANLQKAIIIEEKY